MYPVSSQTNFDPDGTVNLATNADPTFNPWSPNTFAESNLLNTLIFSSLTRWDRNFKAVPDLATSWKVAADGLKWTFNLRKGVKWHDGQPFPAADVAFTFNDIALNQKLGANHSGEYAPVESGQRRQRLHRRIHSQTALCFAPVIPVVLCLYFAKTQI